MTISAANSATSVAARYPVTYRTLDVDGVSVFYREAGDPANPTLLLLHGFPASSHMYRNLIAALAGDFHLVAPDYPGFGNSAMPPADQFAYTFDHMADLIERFLEQLGINRFGLYIQDYGAPIGLRIAARNPERVTALIVQSGNSYTEGLTAFWDAFQPFWRERTAATEAPLRAFLERDAQVWQYTHGVRAPERISPDNWNLDQALLDRPGNKAIQLNLFYDYRLNVGRYPEWQAYLRQHRPPTLVVWGRHDQIFGVAGAEAYARDLPDAEIHLLDTGHFALEEDGDIIAAHIRRFLAAHAQPVADAAGASA